MGAMRKAGVWLGLIEDEDDHRYADDGRYERDYSDRYDDADYDDDLDDEPVLARSRSADRSSVRTLSRAPVSSPMTQDNLALAPQVQLRERAVVSDDDQHGYRITTLHPTTYNEARTIGEHFRESVPVIMNLSEMDEADAKRTSRSPRRTRPRSQRADSSTRADTRTLDWWESFGRSSTWSFTRCSCCCLPGLSWNMCSSSLGDGSRGGVPQQVWKWCGASLIHL